MGELRDRMEQDLILRRLSPSTRRIYLIYCRKFAAYYGRSPTELGESEIRAYLLHLIQVEQVAYGTYRQNVVALKFLYRVTLNREWEVNRIPFPQRHTPALPKVVQQKDIVRLFAAFKRLKYRVLLMTCYSAGLRISEACAIRIKDIDSRRMLIRVSTVKEANRD